MGRINCNIAHAGGMGMFRKLFSAIGEIRKYFIARCLAMFPKVLPVSYTHLDVYKRQP